jgi:hypothetical protein
VKLHAAMSKRGWLRKLLARRRERNVAVIETEEDVTIDPFNPFPEPVTIEITDVIDLHTIAPRD